VPCFGVDVGGVEQDAFRVAWVVGVEGEPAVRTADSVVCAGEVAEEEVGAGPQLAEVCACRVRGDVECGGDGGEGVGVEYLPESVCSLGVGGEDGDRCVGSSWWGCLEAVREAGWVEGDAGVWDVGMGVGDGVWGGGVAVREFGDGWGVGGDADSGEGVEEVWEVLDVAGGRAEDGGRGPPGKGVEDGGGWGFQVFHELGVEGFGGELFGDE